jgi:hypothetical protein
MISKYLKLFLITATFGLAVWNFIEVNIGYGIMLVLLSGLILLVLFRNENMIIAQWHMRKNNMGKSAIALHRIKQPEHLMGKQPAYYYFLKGLTGSQINSMADTERLFKKSLTLGLKNDINKAIIKMNLAAFAMQRRRKREATNLLAEAKKLDKDGMLNDQIKELKKGMGRI